MYMCICVYMYICVYVNVRVERRHLVNMAETVHVPGRVLIEQQLLQIVSLGQFSPPRKAL